MLGLTLPALISRIVVLLTAFSVHEFAHAWTADYFGDDTPRFNGRLTLNPLAHLDPMGSLMLIVAGFGWAKPVPVNPYALRRRSEISPDVGLPGGTAVQLFTGNLGSHPFQTGIGFYCRCLRIRNRTFAISTRVLISLHHNQPGADALQPYPAGSAGWRKDRRLFLTSLLVRFHGPHSALWPHDLAPAVHRRSLSWL